MTLPELLLPSVTLSEVVDGWALQDRQDRKYVVPTERLAALLCARASDYYVLEIDGHRDFTYRTRYYDTSDLATYTDHAHGVRRRFKVRIRHYADSDLSRLEVKTKGARSRTVKFAMDGMVQLDAQGRAFIRRSLDLAYGETYRHDVVGQLRAGLSMTYRRATLVGLGGERVTVDTDLAVGRARRQVLLRPDLALVEVKTAGARSETDRALTKAGFRPMSFSKYAAGIELTASGVRARDARLLQACFGARGLARPGLAEPAF